MGTQFDLVIVGGGIAGMTAAIYAARANLRTLILEKSVCGGLVNTTHVVENFPSYPSIGGMDLMEKVRAHVEGLGVEIREVVEIESFGLEHGLKNVATDEGVFTAPALILATGRKPRKLAIDTNCEQIHYCAICDGSCYKGRPVMVVGGGNSGVDESLYLRTLGVSRIVLIEELDRLLASEKSCQNLLACPEVEAFVSTRIAEIRSDGRLESVLLYNTATGETFERKVDGIFVYIGQDPQTDLLRGQVPLDDWGYIVVDDQMRTSLPGVFAAGDVIHKKFRQITTAMADGTIAALSAVAYLAEQGEQCKPAASVAVTK
jgi:thioredoxin reductase (NADPH)